MIVLKFLMFNSLVKLYLNSDFWFLKLNIRIKSLTLEMWYTLSVFFPILGIIILLTIVFSDPLVDSKWVNLLTLFPFSFLMIALFNKDFFGGQSVVHRKLGYKVLDAKTNNTASKIQCLIRNLTGPIWPIEVIFILISPKRRLGDLIARTILIDVPISDPQLILTEIKESKFDRQTILTLIFSLIFIAIYMFIFDPTVRLLWE